MTPANAQTIALKAATFLAAQETLKEFLNESGLDVGSFRDRLSEPGLLSELLDFLMQNQAMFSQFCEAENFSADNVHNAWKALTRFGIESWQCV